MKKIETGNTILGILLGMLGGIALTSALAWFIFKTPASFVPQNQVVARDLQLPSGVVEELFKKQARTGNPDSFTLVNGYRVRTNSNREVFVQAIPQPGVAPQPEVQVRAKQTAPVIGAAGQRFDFYEILSKTHYNTPATAQPRLLVENQGPAKIAIYDAEPAKITVYDPPKPASQPALVKPAPASHVPAVPRPFVSPAAAPQPAKTPQPAKANVLQPAKAPQPNKAVVEKPTTEKPVSAPNKVTYLEVDFFADYRDAAQLQEKLLAKGMAVQLKEEKVLKKRAGYKVFAGPYLDKKSLNSAKAQLRAMRLNANEQSQ